MVAQARVNYEAYIQSAEWQKRREVALARAAYRCQLCCTTKGLNVHHNTYANLGNERPEDLVCLCKKCHDVYHVKRDERTKKKLRKEKWARQLASQPYRVLPLPPTKPDSNQLTVSPMPVARRKKNRQVQVIPDSGKRVQIVATPEYAESLKTIRGGFTGRAMRLLGKPDVLFNGWLKKNIGKTIEIDPDMLAAELAALQMERDVHNGTPAGLELKAKVRAALQIRMSLNTRNLALELGCSKATIDDIKREMCEAEAAERLVPIVSPGDWSEMDLPVMPPGYPFPSRQRSKSCAEL